MASNGPEFVLDAQRKQRAYEEKRREASQRVITYYRYKYGKGIVK